VIYKLIVDFLKLIEGMSELYWREAGLGLKKLAKRLQVFKSEFVCDLADGKVGRRKLLFGQFDQLVVQMLLRILSGQGFEEPA
jgi:hypothetical protein